MGESILLLQLLPHALQAQEGREGSTEGVTAFLDSAKAYDILVGDFLFEAMRVGAALQPPRGARAGASGASPVGWHLGRGPKRQISGYGGVGP